MKKLVLISIVLVAVLAFVPARALNKGLVYGFVLKPSGPFGPVMVQTYNFGVVTVNVPTNVTTASLFLGADVCCEVDGDGNLFIADLPNESRNYADKRSWMAEVTVWDPDNYNYRLTSPAGVVQVLVDSEMARNTAVRVGSMVKIVAIKSPWAERFTAIELKLVRW